MDGFSRPQFHILRFRSSLIGVMALLSCLLLMATSSRCAFADPATHFSVFVDDFPRQAGDTIDVTVTALDASENVDTAYAGTVHLTSTDARATLPADFTLTNGTAVVYVTFINAGTQTVTATDTANPSITGISNSSFTDSSGPDSATITGAPSAVEPGQDFTFTLVVYDVYGNELTNAGNYPLNMAVDCSDPSANAPFFIDFPGTYDMTFNTPGPQSFSVQSLNYSLSAGFNTYVFGEQPSSFALYFVTYPPAVGQPTQFYLEADDQNGLAIRGYSGTVHVTSTDPNAILPGDFNFVDGVANPTITFMTLGTQSVTMTSTSDPSLTASETDFIVTDPATSLSVNVPTGASVQRPVSITASAREYFGNLASDYTGTVTVTSTDPLAVLPPQVTFAGGQATFDVTFNTPGNQTITLKDKTNSSVTGTSADTTVTVPAHGYVMMAPSPITAGVFFTVHLTALDSAHNPIPNYTGTAHFTSTDPKAVLPPDTTFVNGAANVRVEFKTSGQQTLMAVDAADPTAVPSNLVVNVQANAPAHFKITVPGTVIAGNVFNAVVTAIDIYGNAVTSYSGTLHFASTDPQGVVPADVAITGGSRQFVIKLKTTGVRYLMVSDTVNTSIAGNSSGITVTANAPAHFKVTVPATAIAGNTFNALVTAVDIYGNTVTSYSGTIHFKSTDLQGVVPADVALTGGSRQFVIKLKTTGVQYLTVSDIVNTSIAGNSSGITITAGAASRLTITAPATATNGSAFYGMVKAMDMFGNTATGYTGTIHFTSTDPKAVLPADSGLVNGSKRFVFKLKTSGSQTIKATNTAAPSVTATTSPIGVS